MPLMSTQRKKLSRLYHTVRPLRFEQIWYRLRYKLLPLRRLSAEQYLLGAETWCWQGPEVLAPSLSGEGEVCYLNLPAIIKQPSDWNDPAFAKLWLYNLHYFDDLNAIDSLSRCSWQLALVKRWITDNPAVAGNGWEPYPLSLRLVNWIKWYRRSAIDDAAIVQSIARQAEGLSKQLEFHILGNHLFANAKALVFVGCFLQGPVAEQYLQLGLQLLAREIPEQFLQDGGHFELTPMYHCILLWDLLDLIQLAQITANPSLAAQMPVWSEVATKALHWLGAMIHPDQQVSFFNDSTFGIAATPMQLSQYAQQLGLPAVTEPTTQLTTLPASGYSRVRFPRHVLILDHAAVGPDYLPGHAHADTLSLEWSVGLQRVLVNSGTSLYGVSAERLYQRQTCAHNTVLVNGLDSSEVWSGFRVARRAYAKLLNANQNEQGINIRACHDGYHRLKHPVTHLRTVNATATSLQIIDQLTGAFDSAEARWFLHPKVEVQQLTPTELLLILPTAEPIKLTSSAPVVVSDSQWFPGFGVSVPNKMLLVKFITAEQQLLFCLQ